VVRIILTFVLVGVATFLYVLAFSRSVDEVTVAITNAATFIITSVTAYWFRPIG